MPAPLASVPVQKRCACCKDVKPADEFYRLRKAPGSGNRLSSWCKDCTSDHSFSHHDVSGYILASRVRWVFEELVERVGTMATAAMIGCSQGAIYRIVRSMTRRTQKRFVRRAILVLRELRSTNVWARPKNMRLSRSLPNRCSGCGCHLDEYTNDCTTCRDRKYKRAYVLIGASRMRKVAL